jgi:hypothetical protein
MALLLRVGPGPEGGAEGFGSPLDDCLSPKRRALQAPGAPGCGAAACGHRRNPGGFWERISGGIALAWFAEGGEEAGSEDGAGAWQGGNHGAVGRALGVWRHGMVEGGAGLQGDAERADERVNQEGGGGDEALSGGQWGGALKGLEAPVDDVGVAHMRGAAEALERGAARQRGGVAGGPWAEDSAEEGGVVGVDPVEDVGAVVLQGTGQAMRAAHGVADQTAAGFDKLCEGPHRGAVGREGCERGARREQEFQVECRVSGIGLGRAGRAGVTVLGQGQRIDAAPEEARIVPQGIDARAVVACEAHRHGASCKPLWYGLGPRGDGLRGVFASPERAGVRADGWSADSVCGLGPLETNEGSKRFFR